MVEAEALDEILQRHALTDAWAKFETNYLQKP
jgi:hypothetical protein